MEGSDDRCNSKPRGLAQKAIETLLHPSDRSKIKSMPAFSCAAPPVLCNTESSAWSKNSTDEWSSSSSSSSSSKDGSETDGESESASVKFSEHERAIDRAGNESKRGSREIPQPSSLRRTEPKKARKSSGTCRMTNRRNSASAHGHEEHSDGDDNEPSETLIGDLQATVARLVRNVEGIQDANLEMMNQLLQLAASNIQLLANSNETTSASSVRPGVATICDAPDSLSTANVPSQATIDEHDINFPLNDCLDQLREAKKNERRDEDAKAAFLAQDAAHPHLLELIEQYTKSDHVVESQPNLAG
jgi:hypothetical protein